MTAHSTCKQLNGAESCSARKIISTQRRIKTTASNWDYTSARPSSAFLNEPSMLRNQVLVYVSSTHDILRVHQRVKRLASLSTMMLHLEIFTVSQCFAAGCLQMCVSHRVFTSFLQPSAESGYLTRLRWWHQAKNLQFTTRTGWF